MIINDVLIPVLGEALTMAAVLAIVVAAAAILTRHGETILTTLARYDRRNLRVWFGFAADERDPFAFKR
jgi:hypothetical protein